MRREFKGGSSGRSKADTKRSGKDSPQNALSPYQSHEDLTAHAYEEEDDSWLEDLSAKSSGKRIEAAQKIFGFLQHHNGSAKMYNNTEGIMSYTTRALGPASKASDGERILATRIGLGMLLTYGDDFVTLYQEFVEAAFAAVPASMYRGGFLPAVIDSLALTFALDDQAMIGDTPLPMALAEILPKAGAAHPQIRAAMTRCAAFVADRRIQQEAKDLISRGLVDEDYDVVIAAAEAVGIFSERFPGSFSVDDVAPLLRTTTKEAGRESKRELLPVVRSVVAFLEEKTKPQSTIVMRHSRQAVIEGFGRGYVLDLLKDVAADGTQRQLTQNATVRRVLHVTENFSRPTDHAEFVAEHESRLDKKEVMRDRAKDRDNKATRMEGDDF